jgi:sugar/nucleoside kinase (ribokinase family)
MDSKTSAPVLFVGRATLDVVYALDQFPAPDTKVFARDLRVAPGGPAVNAAITHAMLGGPGALMTAVGGGPWAGPVRRELERLGINLIDLAAGTGYETPLTTVLLDGVHATRTIVNPPRSTIELNRRPGWDPTWGEAPPVALTDGFHLNETMPVLASCREAGAMLILDGGTWKPGTEEIAPLLTAAICSERFAVPGRSVPGRLGDADSTIAWFEEQGVPHVAVTRGPRAILGSDRGHRFEVEIARIDAVDTLGAGDVLHGAFCFHFARMQDFEPALRLAAGIATRSCLRLGIQAWA